MLNVLEVYAKSARDLLSGFTSSSGQLSGLLTSYYCASVKRRICLHEDMQKARHGGMLGL